MGADVAHANDVGPSGRDGSHMTEDEQAAVVADFLSRYSTEVTTNGALRARPCGCEPDGMDWFDSAAFESRCAKCGRLPAA
jgi:hypothetical protein